MCGGGKKQEELRSGLRGGREGKGSAYSREREREVASKQASKAQHTNNAQTGRVTQRNKQNMKIATVPNK